MKFFEHGVLILILCLATTECSSGAFRETEQMVGRHKERIVDQCYGEGHEIKAQIIGFTYHRFTGTWTIDLRLSWQRAADLYWAEGVLAVYPGGAARWSDQRHSHNLRARLDAGATTFESVSLMP